MIESKCGYTDIYCKNSFNFLYAWKLFIIQFWKGKESSMLKHESMEEVQLLVTGGLE